jgi:hypothetical protein
MPGEGGSSPDNDGTVQPVLRPREGLRPTGAMLQG